MDYVAEMLGRNLVRCDRCQDAKDCERFDTVTLCDDCLILILREWRIRRREFGELAS
jgi:hypothetical protein